MQYDAGEGGQRICIGTGRPRKRDAGRRTASEWLSQQADGVKARGQDLAVKTRDRPDA